MTNIYLIDGRFVFESLRNSEIVLNYRELGVQGNLRRYYTGVLKGRKPPAIAEWLRYNGYFVKLRHGETENDHIVDMAVDIVHYAHVYKYDLSIYLITDKVALLPAIELAQSLGTQIVLISSSNSALKRNSCNFQTLQEFMNFMDLVEAKDFTQDKLEARSWVDLHADDPRDLIREY
jgi:hypothetical protein